MENRKLFVVGIVTLMLFSSASVPFWYGADEDSSTGNDGGYTTSDYGQDYADSESISDSADQNSDYSDTNTGDSYDNSEGSSWDTNNSGNPPTISGFTITNISSVWATISATSDKPGQAYFVVLSKSASAPTSEQIKEGLDGAGNAALLLDEGPATEGWDQFPVYNLSPGSDYVLYFVIEDQDGNLSEVKSAQFSTSGQNTSSGSTTTTTTNGTGTNDTSSNTSGTGNTTSTSAGTGTSVTNEVLLTVSGLTANNVTGSSSTVSFQANRSGTGYFALFQSGATWVSAEDLRSGKSLTGAIPLTKNTMNITEGANQLTIKGLSPAMSYTLYFSAASSSSSIITPPLSTHFTTQGSTNTTSSWTSSTVTATGSITTNTGNTNASGSTSSSTGAVANTGSSLTISWLVFSGATSSGATVFFNSNGTGTAYYAVHTSGAAAPTTQALMGSGQNLPLAIEHRSINVQSGSNRIDIFGLTPGSSYTLYITTGNRNEPPMSVNIKTHP